MPVKFYALFHNFFLTSVYLKVGIFKLGNSLQILQMT